MEWLSTFIGHRPTWHILEKKKKTSIDAGSDSEEEESQNENYREKADPLQRLQRPSGNTWSFGYFGSLEYFTQFHTNTPATATTKWKPGLRNKMMALNS